MCFGGVLKREYDIAFLRHFCPSSQESKKFYIWSKSLFLLHLFKNNAISLKLMKRLVEEFTISALLTVLYIPQFEFTAFTVILFVYLHVLHQTVTMFRQ
jgi:hypothetical protein